MKFNKPFGLLIIAILFFSCEMKFPEKWDTPSWHLPINFPLQDETYFFSGMVDSNTILLSEDSTLIVLFEDSLSAPNGGRVGIDSTFNSYFRIDGLETPEVEGIIIEPMNISVFDTSIYSATHLSDLSTPEIDLALIDCFPNILLENGMYETESFSETIYNENEIEVFNSIDSVSVTDGLLSVFVFNEFPFNITSIKIDMFTAGESIWQVEINNVGENESENRTRIITDINPLILKESILFQYELTVEPQEGSDVCITDFGWALNGNHDRSIILNIDLNFSEIGQIAGNLKEFVYEQEFQMDIPNPENIWLSGGYLSSGDTINHIGLGFTNNLFTDMNIGFGISELFNEYGENFQWNQNLNSGTSLNYNLSIEELFLHPNDTQSDTLKQLNLLFSGVIESQDIVLDPNIEYSFSIDEIVVEPIQLDYINAILHEMDFSSPSIQIDDVPEGFSGFTFADVTLEMNIFNQIGIPVTLDMFLAGVRGNDTTKVPLKDSLYTPKINDGFIIGDIVKSNIIMTGTHQISTWYNEEEIVKQDTVFLESSFLDIMNFAPDEIIIGGESILDGSGTLAPETYVWGDFKLNLPLSFIFEPDMNIIPSVTTEMSSMNEESKNQINNGLVSANLNVNIENHSPLAMTLSLLISTREDFFPHYLDDFISGSLITNQSYISTEAFDYLYSLNVSRIEVESLSNDEGRALRVIFRNENLTELFWVGRIADITIPEAEEINSNTGHVIKSGFGDDVIELSVDKMEWLTSNNKRYSRPMLEFVGSNGEPRTLRSTDYLKVSAYISVILDTGAF
ncbi:MAG: hypothetical protein H8E60_01215 [Candidatus Marinimicrobia bacterium]|nr:hypothetical protein [Candidatus Neomarinimicrobiota bacterium]